MRVLCLSSLSLSGIVIKYLASVTLKNSNRRTSTATEEKQKKDRKQRYITLGFFALSIVVVAVIAIIEFGGKRDRSVEDIHIVFPFIFAVIGCFLTGLICETIKYYVLLESKGYYRKTSLAFSTAVIGKYYDNLTPAGAGGQPFQIVHLKKHGCDKGTSYSLPILGFLGLQFAFVLIGLVVMIAGHHLIADLDAIRITAIVGLCFYAFIPVCILLFAIIPRPLEKILQGLCRLLYRLKIVKDPYSTSAKALETLSSYTDALREYKNRPRILITV